MQTESKPPSGSDPDNDLTPITAGEVISELITAIKPRTDCEMSDYQAAARRRRSAMRRHDFVAQVGVRYEDCTLENFRVEVPAQAAIVERLQAFADKLRDHVRAGHGLILYGPVGTGKDHLMAGLLRTVAVRGITTFRWVSGVDLYGKMRDRLDSCDVDYNETTLIREFVRPGILAISDPLPPAGELSGFNAQTLYRIIDGRYRDRKPTWLTLNVADRDEAKEGLTAPILDRLRHDSLALFCNWSSYRKPLDAERLR